MHDGWMNEWIYEWHDDDYKNAVSTDDDESHHQPWKGRRIMLIPQLLMLNLFFFL